MSDDVVPDATATEGEARFRRYRDVCERDRHHGGRVRGGTTPSSSRARAAGGAGDEGGLAVAEGVSSPVARRGMGAGRKASRPHRAPRCGEGSAKGDSHGGEPRAGGGSRRRSNGARGGCHAACATEPHRQDPSQMEARWEEYLQGEEFYTFHAVVDSLLSLPPASELGDKRSEYELLLHLLHRLGNALEVEHVSKSYRAHYSPDVQLYGYLYSTLLTAFTLLPSYVLNGQEFYVSDTVLDQCQSLQFVFHETCKELRRQFENLQACSLEQIRSDVRRSLAYFDRSWCRFEMPALEEIEAIHRQACRPLIEAIEVEQALSDWERKSASAARGGPLGARGVRDAHRNRLMEKICELNRLANIDGKGRNDMDMTSVLEAERLDSRPLCAHLQQAQPQQPQGEHVSPAPTQHHNCAAANCASPVLLRIARSLLRCWRRLRRMLQKYARCLYQLNSHLANNPDLVRALELFESAWETASRYLVQPGPRRLAMLTYDIVTAIEEPSFQTQLTSLDPGFLVATLPRALLFHEMNRFKEARCGSISGSSQPHAIKPPFALKGRASSVDAAIGLPGPSMLPRPLQQPEGKQEGSSRETRRAQASAFQHSPIARAFLPADAATAYNEAAATLGRMPAASLAKLRKQLASSNPPSPVASCDATPLHCSSTPPLPPQRKPITPAAERPPRTPCPPRMAVPNSSHGRSSSSRVSVTAAADKGAVVGRPAPGSSSGNGAAAPVVSAASGTAAAGTAATPAASALGHGPAARTGTGGPGTGGGGGGGGGGQGAGTAAMGGSAAASAQDAPRSEDAQDSEEEEEEEQVLTLPLADIHGAEVAAALGVQMHRPPPPPSVPQPHPPPLPSSAAPVPTPPPQSIASPQVVVRIPEEARRGYRSNSEQADWHHVMSAISTLALHLQRTKPHEWNELIQVVLQGVMLASSVRQPKAAAASAGMAAAEVW